MLNTKSEDMGACLIGQGGRRSLTARRADAAAYQRAAALTRQHHQCAHSHARDALAGSTCALNKYCHLHLRHARSCRTPPPPPSPPIDVNAARARGEGGRRGRLVVVLGGGRPDDVKIAERVASALAVRRRADVTSRPPMRRCFRPCRRRWPTRRRSPSVSATRGGGETFARRQRALRSINTQSAASASNGAAERARKQKHAAEAASN